MIGEFREALRVLLVLGGYKKWRVTVVNAAANSIYPAISYSDEVALYETRNGDGLSFRSESQWRSLSAYVEGKISENEMEKTFLWKAIAETGSDTGERA